MATTSTQTQGYQCEFIDSVPSDFYCKKCNLVARSLTICSCCTESYCHAYITDTQKQGKPCPTCGEEDFLALPHVKYQKRMKELQVYCNLKERGCCWSGTLDQLDTHLDPDQVNCQYVDTKCPLHCKQVIPKSKVEQHVAEECIKRDYICKYCSFKASYEEVVNTHLPKCVYVPLDCPNNCGITFERDFLEYHLKQCSLQEIECEFSGVGCKDRFKREDQEEHTRQNSHKHLTLTASLAKQLEQKLEDQDKKHRKEETILKKTIENQQNMIEEQKQKLKEQEELIDKEFIGKLQKLEEIFKQKLAEHSGMIVSMLNDSKTYEIRNYRNEIKKGWMSPAMYTKCGHKFCITFFIDIFAYLCIKVHSMPVEFDHLINWPAKAKITIELINQRRGNNVVYAKDAASWDKPTQTIIYTYTNIHQQLLHVLSVPDFLVNDTLHFTVSLS